MMNDPNAPLTISVPEAGERYFGLCRNATYNAAAEPVAGEEKLPGSVSRVHPAKRSV